ncbi:MAG: DUF1573 domain-containing protein [Dysgonamonadaceae bacterium]|jgi:hypothetical protein|nr:DUF1573 domain-containing protein [Dysgonamonadaceae bacterium]
MDKKMLKFLLIIPALAGVCMMASVPNYPLRTEDNNVWLATEGEITVDKTVHDFGNVKQDAGKLDAVFTVTNNTQAPIVLTNVVPSCGCTAATYTKEPIEPGKKGHVVATFNPNGRPGPFDKTVAINTSGNPERIVVRIKGMVE